jgi:hypothetical protein
MYSALSRRHSCIQASGSLPLKSRFLYHVTHVSEATQRSPGNRKRGYRGCSNRALTVQRKAVELPNRAVNPIAYTAMYEHALRSRNTGGLSASQSQGFHLEAELMLVGGAAGDSDASFTGGRDLAQLSALDTHTVAAVECPEDATLTEFLGLTRQRCAPRLAFCFTSLFNSSHCVELGL